MRSALMLFLLFVLSALIAPIIAGPALSLSVSGATQPEESNSLKVKATLQNAGDEILRLLNDPRSVMAPEWDTNTFGIAKVDDGAAPSFAGVLVKWSPELARANNLMTILAPGQSVEFVHDLAKAYDFSRAGRGNYTIDAFDNLFTHVDASGNLVSIRATTNPTRLVITLSEKHYAGSHTSPSHRLTRRAQFLNCTDEQQDRIMSALNPAQKYAEESVNYLDAQSSSTTRYESWFGKYSPSDKQTVLGHYKGIAGANMHGFKYDCSCNRMDAFAYVYPRKFGTIYLCAQFFNAKQTGHDSRAGTLIHETLHFVKLAGTMDNAYGQKNCRALAKDYPDKARANADSHEYFAENIPHEK
ncbi:hypothetical protein BOTBODRAFT_38025 [Botryobasidium botryosum FD-172 SS1]|uniref:Lysine-specific metallo-endopeptidase domain-containing protein n=1 Tax=Botryobasidium botryosum (strain FD-172 SS1) TaxID=930990 RepID=A0A067LYN0_BOTB1|nr:hypothetical protein BOTBODRAFT_38025 [Botryobasidium botryosum FD-172 SS1]